MQGTVFDGCAALVVGEAVVFLSDVPLREVVVRAEPTSSVCVGLEVEFLDAVPFDPVMVAFAEPKTDESCVTDP